MQLSWVADPCVAFFVLSAAIYYYYYYFVSTLSSSMVSLVSVSCLSQSILRWVVDAAYRFSGLDILYSVMVVCHDSVFTL